MKKSFTLLVSALLIASAAKSQALKNGSFENWDKFTYKNPDIWSTSNDEFGPKANIANATQVTDKVSGNYALKLETLAPAPGDSRAMFGFAAIANTKNGLNGGVPYTQMPQLITGSYKYDIKGNDAALIIVIFKKNGVNISENMYPVTGTQSTYTNFSLPLIPPSGGETPDSVIVGVVSSNAFDETMVTEGSVIYVDNLAFAGTGVFDPIPNGDFENWTDISQYSLNGWPDSRNAIRTTDSYEGTYAIQIISTGGYDDNNNQFYLNSSLSNALYNNCPNNGPCTPVGGWPFAVQKDTIVGYYKYIPAPSSGDTASINFNFKKDGMGLNGMGTNLEPAAVYTRFEVPFDLMDVPDTIVININSSMWPAMPEYVGSALTIDNLHLKSEEVVTGISEKENAAINIAPNPASSFCNIRLNNLKGESSIRIMDLTGKTVAESSFNVTGLYNHFINTTNFTEGLYFIRLTTNGKSTYSKLMVKH